MTVIAYKDGLMAGDGRVTSEKGHIWTDKARKVFKLADGSLFGAAGDWSTEIMRNHLTEAGDLSNFPQLPDGSDIDGIYVRPNGRIFMFDGKGWERWPDPYIAIGSGKQNALTALQLGCDALIAVRMGIKGNCGCGGLIRTVMLKGKK